MAQGDVDFGRVADDMRRAAASFALLTSSATAFGFAVQAFREFEAQLVATNAIAGGTQQTLERMGEAARRFSLVTTTSALDAVKALQELTQAGFSAEQALAGMSGVLLLAQATLTDVAVSADLVASNIQAFGLATSETYRVANVFTASITASLASVDKLAYAMRQVAPVARLAGLSIEETTAALSVLFNVGLRGEQAGTALRNIIIRLVRPLGEAGDLLREAGIATRTATGEFRNLAEIMQDIADSDLNDADLARIFETEALAGVKAFINALEDIGPAGENGYERLLAAVTGTDKALELAVENLQTFDGQMKLLQNSLIDVAKTVGEALVPTIQSIAEFVENLIDSYRNLDADTKALVDSFIRFGAILAAITVSMGALQLVVQALALRSLISGVVGLAGAFASLNASIALLPATLGRVIALSAGATRAVTLFSVALRAIPIVGLTVGLVMAADYLFDLGSALDFVTGKTDALTDTIASFDQSAFVQAQVDAKTATDNLLGQGTVEEVTRRVGLIQQQLELLQNSGANPLDIYGFAERQQPVVQRNQADLQEIIGLTENEYNEIIDFIARYERQAEEGRARVAAAAEDGITSLDAYRVYNQFQEERADLLAELTPEQFALAQRVQEILRASNQSGEQAQQLLQSLEDAQVSAVQEFIASLQDGSAVVDDQYGLAVLAIEESGILNGGVALREEIAKIVTDAEIEASEVQREILRLLLDRAGVADDDIYQLLFQEEIQRNTELIQGLEDLRDLSRRQSEETRQRALELELDKADNLADALRLATAAGNAQLQLDLQDLAAKLEEQFGEVLVDFGIDLRDGQEEILRKAIEDAGIDLDTSNIPGFSEVIDGTWFIEGARQQISESTTPEQAQQIIAEQAELYRQIVEAYVAAAVAAGQLTEDQAAALREASAAAVERAQLAFLEGIAETSDALDQAREEEQRRQEAAQREQDRLNREAERLAREAEQAADRARDQARAVKDAFDTLADTTRDARRSYLDALRAVSVGDRIDETLQLDLQSITAGYDRQILELQREFEDLARDFSGNPVQLQELAAEYDALINQVEALKQAEIEAADSFTAQMERRSNALELFQRDLTDVAFDANETFTSVGAGIARAFAEYQKELVGIIDITESATTGLIDTLSTGIGDFIYDTENAWENFKKNMLDISRQIFEGFTKALIQQSISSLTGGGGSIFSNALQPGRGGSTELPGIGTGGLLGRLFPGLAGAFGGQQAENTLLDPLENTLTDVSVLTEQVYRDALNRTETVLTNFTNGLATAFTNTVNAVAPGSITPGASGVTTAASVAQQAATAAGGFIDQFIPGFSTAIGSAISGATGVATQTYTAAAEMAGVQMANTGFNSLQQGIIETANALQIDPVDLATVISYETGGTFDPLQRGPTTQWGQHRGLIQFGEPQAAMYGVDFSSPEAALQSQLGANGAIVDYLLSSGFQPGMGILDLYSTINAGAPGRYNATDANNGGAPGTVLEKVNEQFAGHYANAEELFAGFTQDLSGITTTAGQVSDQLMQTLPNVAGTNTGAMTTLPGIPGSDPNALLQPLTGGAGTTDLLGGAGTDLLGGGAVPGLDQAVQSITSAVNQFGTNLANVFNQFIQSMQVMAQQVAAGAGVTYTPVTAVGLGGGATGGLGGLGSLFGGLTSLLGFDEGGFTGDIDPRRIAGVVHGGEFVINKQATDQWRPLLEMINNGQMPGYAEGGYVGGGSFSGSMVNSNNSQGDSISLRVTYVMGGGGNQNGFRRSASQHAKMLMRQLDKAKRNT